MDLSDVPSGDPAPALGRGIAILRHLDEQGSCSLEQLARHFHWPKASLLRLTESLRRAGVVQRDTTTKRYRSLVQLVTVAAAPAAGEVARAGGEVARAAAASAGHGQHHLIAAHSPQDLAPCFV
jgi:DNA-binding IclR family transcriptional regulator